MPGEFDKDFGYLMPFLDKIGEAATSLSNPAARDELRELVAGEKQRWARIKVLLAGSPASEATAATRAPSNPAPPASPESTPAEARALPQFTVGSLKGSRGSAARS